MSERHQILTPLLVAWDDLDLAIKRVQTSLPDQLSASVTAMEAARLAYQTVLRDASREPK